MKVWGESEYYLNLENEDKKRYKERSTLSNDELLPDPNISISWLLICKLFLCVDTNAAPCDSLLIIKKKIRKKRTHLKIMQPLKSDK